MLACFSTAQGAVRKYTLELNNDIVAPDGFPRSAVIVNHQLPGTVISINKNDQLQVKVVNNLTDNTMAQGTSIHWHGIFQHNKAAQDGVAWVTQCPISPGDTYLYNFNVGEQTGTYWYHSHLTTQYCDGLGLRSIVILLDPKDPLRHLYDVDDESTIITLSDWYHQPSPTLFLDLSLIPTVHSYPESHLMNGRGRQPGGLQVDLAVVNVDRNKRYRFRLLNAACLAAYNFSIDGHAMTVIETDGSETIPHEVDIVPLFPGQRVSVVVKADQPINNYCIPVSLDPGTNVGILRYAGAPNSDPTSQQTDFNLLREEDLVISHGTPDVHIELDIGITRPMGNFLVNGVTFAPPPVPVLLQILSGSLNPFAAMPNGSVIALPRNKLIEVTIPGDSPLAPHPMHLHGHQFAVTRSAGSQKINTVNPPLRDVVSAGMAGDNVTFRFRTDNPGPWILHCHIDFHLEAGLAIVFAEDIPDQLRGPDSEMVTKGWKNLCPKWNALKSGKQFSVNDFM
ncbi:multicopper oxidase [Amanita thiersii Skay4041]|uniref:laccase n=1 Tax=Amanita thiersii Skay4041 TaxID=703135 RepID=A0A2A9N9J9_9AGAR|nr:multicopper oxidase [Amanita thiersii Skay4041]